MASTRRTDSPTRPSSRRRAGALIFRALSRAFRRLARTTCEWFGGTLEDGWWFGVAPFGVSCSRSQPDRVEDLGVAGAPAEVPAQSLADLLGRRRPGSSAIPYSSCLLSAVDADVASHVGRRFNPLCSSTRHACRR